VAFDTSTQRHILGRFATGITVITTKVDDELCGLTANAFASLSLNPPLVLVAIDHRAHSYEKLKASRTYAVNQAPRILLVCHWPRPKPARQSWPTHWPGSIAA